MRKGFTLIELLIYMGLMATVLVVLTDIFVSVLQKQTETSSISAVEQDGRYILARLRYDVTRASAIISPSLGESTNSAQLTIGGATYTYQVGANQDLTISDGTDTDNLTSFRNSVTYLSFRRLGNVGGKNSLQINFQLTSRVVGQSGTEVRDFQTTAGLR